MSRGFGREAERLFREQLKCLEDREVIKEIVGGQKRKENVESINKDPDRKSVV